MFLQLQNPMQGNFIIIVHSSRRRSAEFGFYIIHLFILDQYFSKMKFDLFCTWGWPEKNPKQYRPAANLPGRVTNIILASEDSRQNRHLSNIPRTSIRLRSQSLCNGASPAAEIRSFHSSSSRWLTSKLSQETLNTLSLDTFRYVAGARLQGNFENDHSWK